MVQVETIKYDKEKQKVIRTLQSLSKDKKKSKKKVKVGKILKKPTAKGIKPVSAVAVVKGLASQNYRLVREVERPEIERDDRSLFFKSEMEKERKRWI